MCILLASSSSVLTNVFWICLLLGFVWLTIQLFISGFGHDFGSSTFDMHVGDLHAGDLHAGDVGVDHGGHAGADTHAPGGEALSPVSPMVIAGFITTFGATGAILQVVTKLDTSIIVLISLASGFVGGYIVWFLLSKLIRAVSGTSEARVAELIGIDAEVITPIKSSAVGEIAYIAGGSRYTSPARSIDNTAIDRNKIVKIVRIVGPTYFVREIKHEETQEKQS